VRVFVTGASGFVGRRLLPHLARAGCAVTGADREVDVTREDELAGALADTSPQAVIHLAAQSHEAGSPERAEATWRVNYGGALALLRGVRRVVPRARVLLVGSGIAYGPAALDAPPFREDAPLRPASPYARSKAAADLLGGVFAERGLDVVRVRPFNHSGPGQSTDFALPAFARQVAEIEAGRCAPRIATGNLEGVRDWLHVDDVVEAYRRLLDPAVPAGAYNVASGRGVRVGALLDGLLARAGVEATIDVRPERVRPTDALVGDAARLRAARVPNSGPVDRFYFRSLYFREPNGILFELATDGPGFTVDEPLASLGQRLSLPPGLEPRRREIEAQLKPL